MENYFYDLMFGDDGNMDNRFDYIKYRYHEELILALEDAIDEGKLHYIFEQYKKNEEIFYFCKLRIINRLIENIEDINCIYMLKYLHENSPLLSSFITDLLSDDIYNSIIRKEKEMKHIPLHKVFKFIPKVIKKLESNNELNLDSFFKQ